MEGVEEPIRYVICFRACMYNIYNMYPYFEQVFFFSSSSSSCCCLYIILSTDTYTARVINLQRTSSNTYITTHIPPLFSSSTSSSVGGLGAATGSLSNDVSFL